MRTLGDLLPKDGLVVASRLDEQTVFFVCRRILVEMYGAKGSENIIPQTYKDKKLYLSPRSSLWSNEVWLEREQILKKINLTVGSEAVMEIKLAQQS